jgi:hypothetical protein
VKHLLVLALLASPALADTPAPAVEKAKLEIQPSGKAFTKITIDNPLGDVIVEGYAGKSLRIESRKVAPDDDGLERLRISLVPNPDGTVSIRTTADKIAGTATLKRGQVRVDLKVYAPHDARIEATSSAGAVRISNLDNGGEIDTASGEIEVSNVSGEVTTNSVSGTTRIQQVLHGSVESSTLDADLAFDSIAGERLVASANQGKITGRRVRSREIQLTTNHGAISLEAEAMLRGRIIVASLKGDIEVKMRRQNQPVLARAYGPKVNLGGVATTMAQGGWHEARLGNAEDKNLPMLVEMRSRVGNIRLVFVP